MTASLQGVGRDGALRLAFARRGAETTLVENYSRAPLQVMRAIPDAAGCLCVYLLSPTGGVVQGDRYDIRLTLADGAHALFTTQSATKVYRMPDGHAEQCVSVEVGPDALLEYLPDAMILFAGAELSQHTDIVLRRGALTLVYDIVMPGRLARGEFLQFRRFANRLTVRDEAGLLLYESSDIVPERDDLTALGRLDGYACWGSAYLLGDLAAWGVDADALVASQAAFLPAKDAIGGMTRLYRNGLCLRLLSQRLETIYAAFEALRMTVRRDCFNLPHAPLRK